MVAICKVCFDDPRIPLKKAVIPTYKLQPSNPTNHLVTQHTPDEVPEYWEKVNEKGTPKEEIGKIKKGAKNLIVQSTIPEYSTGEDVVKKANELLYQFFNSANISINQTSNIYLNKLL